MTFPMLKIDEFLKNFNENVINIRIFPFNKSEYIRSLLLPYFEFSVNNNELIIHKINNKIKEEIELDIFLYFYTVKLPKFILENLNQMELHDKNKGILQNCYELYLKSGPFNVDNMRILIKGEEYWKNDEYNLISL